MNSEKLIAAFRIVRPFNVLIMMIVIAAAVLLSGGMQAGVVTVLVAALVGGLVGGGANAINDYFDVDIDRINKPDRPLAKGDLNRRTALYIWLGCTLGGISLNLFLNSASFWIAVSASAALFLYSAALKGTVLLGNLLVAAVTGLALIYGGVVAGFPEQAYFPAFFAFLINFGREIVKDVEDREGDKAGNALTLPVKYGVPKALVMATVTFIILMGSTLVPFTLGIYGTRYLVIVNVVNILVIFVIISMWSDSSPSRLGRLNNLLKIGMLIGLIAIYAA